METHVVMMQIGFIDGQRPSHIITEVFRGSEEECFELCVRIPGCSHDRRPVGDAWLQVGTISDWEHARF